MEFFWFLRMCVNGIGNLLMLVILVVLAVVFVFVFILAFVFKGVSYAAASMGSRLEVSHAPRKEARSRRGP